MNKAILCGVIAAAGLSLAGCDDFLDDNRYPITLETDSPDYWGNPDNCVLQENKMYNWFSGYGNTTGQGWYYFKTLSDDQVGTSFTDWANVNVPASSSNYSDPYTYIRACNYVKERIRTAKPALSDVNLRNFEGVARLNRAYQYYQLVRMYGDVVWIGDIVEPTDEATLMAPRTDRDIVMDSVLRDLDYAAAAITKQNDKMTWSKDLALAMKSEICLYEGTYCRYRTQEDNGKAPNEERAKKYLEESAKASAELINSGRYSVNTTTVKGTNYGVDFTVGAYQFNYNQDLKSASKNTEMIFMKGYQDGVFMNSIINYTCSSTAISGLSKDAFDSYLFKDGLPKALTAEDTSDVGFVDEDGNYCISNLLAVRDHRLAETIDPFVYYTDMTWTRPGGLAMTSRSGYGVAKYDNLAFTTANRVNANTNIGCAPLYWISYIMCNYAEARAELNVLTNDDLDKSLNKLFERAELPTRTVAELSAIADPANNMNVSNLIWEVRRCRRCELIMDNWIRYWDLVRWHQLHLLDNTKYPNILLGANMTAAPVSITNVDGYVQAYTNQRKFDKKYYFYPIPSGQITLNEHLTQNPGWK